MFKWFKRLKDLFNPKEMLIKIGPLGSIRDVASGLITSEVSQILDEIDKINAQHYKRYGRFKVKIEVRIIDADIFIKTYRNGREVSRKIPLIDIIQYNLLPKILQEMLELTYIYIPKGD